MAVFNMTPGRIADAHRAMCELKPIAFPYHETRELCALVRRLEEEKAVVFGFEKAMLEKYGGEVTDGRKISFENVEAAIAFKHEQEAFMNTPEPIDLPTVDLSVHVDRIQLSPNALKALEGIIIFEKEEVSENAG